MVKIKNKEDLADYREQTIDMCADQVHKKAGDIMREDIEYQHTRSSRLPGSGPHRVDQSLQVREDMYSRLFLASFHAEYIFDYRKEQEDDQAMEDQIVEKYFSKPKKCLEDLVLEQEDTENKNIEELNAGIQQPEEEEEKAENDKEINES